MLPITVNVSILWSTLQSGVMLFCFFIVIPRIHSAPCETAQLNVPSQSEVQEYMKANPPNPNDRAFFSKGLFQGDITKYRYNNFIKEKEQINTSETVNAEAIRWPNKLIPYKFYERTDPITKKFAEDAMEDIESKTCVRFVPLTYEEDYIKISPGASCAASVGYQKGEQIVSLNPGCQDDIGATQHEFLHALGMIHEQARPDRNSYVYINYSNMLPEAGIREQFYIFSNAEVTDLGIPYDYDSVMHYPVNAFAIDNNHPTVIPRQRDKRIGNRVKLSKLDIRRINRLYRCDDNPLDYQEKPIPPEVDAKYRATFKNYSKLCDGVKDTPEGWDERPGVCLRMCSRLDAVTLGPDGRNLFNMQGTKRCRAKNTLCTGKDDTSQPDCARYCRLGGYFTMPDTGQCLHVSKLCDGKNDTKNGMDENATLCRDLCLSKSTGLSGDLFSFPEDGNRCMSKTKLCNALYPGPLSNTTNCAKYCKGNGYAPVGKTMQCLHWNQLCDGHVDIPTAEDEDPAICKSDCEAAMKESDGELYIAPKTSRCMSKRSLCDGEQFDAQDTSEETETCLAQCHGSGYINTVDTDQCIRLTDLCDGKMDSRTGWDERSDNCREYCKNAPDWPPEGQTLQVNPDTWRCELVNGSRNAEVTPAPATTDPNKDKRITILSRGHKIMGCSEDTQRIKIVSAKYTADEPDPACPDTDEFRQVADKCDQMQLCGFDPLDPSKTPGCMERAMEVVYRCTEAKFTFEIDPGTAKLTGGGPDK